MIVCLVFCLAFCWDFFVGVIGKQAKVLCLQSNAGDSLDL